MITIKIEGADELIKKLGRAGSKMKEEVNNAIKKSILLVEGEARKNVDTMTKTHTGHLKGRWGSKFGDFKGSLYPMVNYAPYIHEGTAPHKIYPRKKKALFWEGARHPVKSVSHPGIKPRKFLEKAVIDNTNKIKSFFIEVFKKIF